jgi:hypothetical protein
MTDIIDGKAIVANIQVNIMEVERGTARVAMEFFR